ncbi:MAG: hypothetical protein NTV34_17425 [Proteobacteria bacterium]|nr:hypothetical protein [Pseudomonadota bacterium]
MNSKTKSFSILLAICQAILLTNKVEAIGGRGGGGGGPGGGFRPSPSRPSMPSRPATMPSRPAPGPRPGTQPVRPNPGNGLPGNGPQNGGFNRPGGAGPGPMTPRPGQLPARPGGRPNAGDISGAIGNHPPGHFPGTPGNRPGYTGYHKTEMTQNINRHFVYNPVYGGYPFGRGWCGHNWPYWTGVATGAAVASWIRLPGGYNGYGSSQQLVYYPVQAAPQAVYDDNVATVSQVVEQGQGPVADDAQWLNIGAFGLIVMNQKDIGFSIQLGMTSDGSVRGMQWDMNNNTTVEVVGSIDKDTLRIAWQQKDAPMAPYFETNVDQLTQQESLVNVYDPATKSMVSWQVIQIDEKDLPPQN